MLAIRRNVLYGWRMTDKDWLKLKVKGVDLKDATSATIDYSFLGGAGPVYLAARFDDCVHGSPERARRRSYARPI